MVGLKISLPLEQGQGGGGEEKLCASLIESSQKINISLQEFGSLFLALHRSRRQHKLERFPAFESGRG